jgi:hypothetical protein
MSLKICPVYDKNWNSFVKKHGGGAKGERAAYKAWLENDYKIPSISTYDLGNLGKVTEELRKYTEMPILVNTEIGTATEVITEDGIKKILINPTKFKDDAIVSEFGHLFTELLGGMDATVNKNGYAKLENSHIIKILKDQKPELSEQELKQAALSIALTKGPEALFSDKDDIDAFEKWSRGFYALLKRKIKIDKEDAEKLASSPVFAYKSEKIDYGKIEEELYELNKEVPFEDLPKKEQLVRRAMQILEVKISQLTRTLDSTAKDGDKKAKDATLGQLNKLYKQFEKARAEVALINFAKLADKQTKVVEEKFAEYIKGMDDKTGKPSLSSIAYLKNAMLSFDIALLKDVRSDLKPDQVEEREAIDRVILRQDSIYEMYKTLAAKYVIDEVKPSVDVIDSRYKRKAEIEFVRRFRDFKSKKEKDAAKEKYIEEYLEKHKDKIKKDKEKYLRNFLTVIHRDLSTFDVMVGNPKDLNNDIVQTVAELFDRADFDTRQESLFMVKRAEDAYQNYVKVVGKQSDQKKQWEPLLNVDEDGNLLPVLVNVGSKKYKEIKSGKYKGTAVEEMYDLLIEMGKERDKKIPSSHRLGRELPIMHRNFYERVGESNFWTAVKEGTVDQVLVRKDETDFGELDESSSVVRYSLDKSVKTTTSLGAERKLIPIHYRNRTIKKEDRSFDVLTLMVMDSYQGIDYDNKRKIAAQAEAILDLAKEAKVHKTSGILNRLVTDKFGNPTKKEGTSNVVKAIENIIENRLYGVRYKGGVRAAKLSKNIRQYTSFVNLFFNYISGGANFNQGMAMVFMEGAGSKHYSIKNVYSAAKKYRKDTPAIFKDNVERVFKSKTNLLSEMFDNSSDFRALHAEFSKNNILKREANLSIGFGYNSTAEHMAQNVGMYAVLDNIKVKNKDGKYINKKGEVVEDREKAMSLDEAYSVGYQNKKTKKTISKEAYDKLTGSEKGDYIGNVLHLDSRVESTDRTPEKTDTYAISQILKRVNRDLFGNYDKNNASIMERHAIGAFFTQMRGWLEPSFKKRWKGINTLYIRDKETFLKFRTVKNYELRDEDLIYNRETKEFEEGMYISFLRYSSNVIEDLKALKFTALSENWKDLTDLEKNNIRKTVMELGLTAFAQITFVVLSSAIKNMDDDEDKKMITLAALYSKRLATELMTYYHPGEWLRTFRSPAVVVTLADSIIEALYQVITAPTEEFQSGPHKGDNKAIIKMLKVTPARPSLTDPESLIRFYQR